MNLGASAPSNEVRAGVAPKSDLFFSGVGAFSGFP